MQHTDHLSKTEESIYFVIDIMKRYSQDGFIASIYLREHSELALQKRLAEIRQCLSIAHFEYLSLAEYSLIFNRLWATEDNKRYATAQRMFQMLKNSMEALKREFRKSCPISHARLPKAERKISVFKDSVLTRGGCSRDLFGIESFGDTVQSLFYEQRALFTNVLASLLICSEVINKEKQIRANPELCVELLLRQCDEIIADLKTSLKYTQAPVTCEIQQLIEKMGLKQVAQQGFHQYGLDEVTQLALCRNAHQQQPQAVSVDISKYYQKAEDIDIAFKCFDEFRPEPTRQKPTALKVLMVVNWLGGTYESPDRRYYDLLVKNCPHKLPEWHTVSTRKNHIDNFKQQQEEFNSSFNAFIAQKKAKETNPNVV